MRNFRKAALAGATAVAVAFGSTAVATAQTEGTEAPEAPAYEAPTRQAGKIDRNEQEAGSSTKIGNFLGVWEKDEDGNVQLNGTDGRALFGSSTDSETQNGGDFGSQPPYAKAGFVLSIFTGVSALVGLIVGPLYNFFVHGDFNF
ncbi:hypothetical protein ACUW8P_000988 [Corynebacterium afermentans]